MKRLITFLLTALFLLLATFSVFAKEPEHYFATSEEHACYIEHGKVVTNRWIQDDKDNWYYADNNGDFLKNTWFQDTDGKWYYLGKWAMLHDTNTPDGYYVDSDGVWTGEEKGAVSSKPKSPGEAIEQKENAE